MLSFLFQYFNIFEMKDTGKKDTRSGFGEGLLQLGIANENIVALCADLVGSLKMDSFAKKFPDRFIQCGISEANMIGVAAGLTIGGKIPFVGTFANFATGRVYDQIRQSVCYSNKNIKICASHAGLTLGEDGATHQILEDIGLMKMLPGMTVIVPCDYNQTLLSTLKIAEIDGPVYLRFGRPKVPNFTLENDLNFSIGKIQTLIEGNDLTIFTNGHLVWTAIQTSDRLKTMGISASVVNVHTVKPLDHEGVIEEVARTRKAIVIEEHQINGGLGDSIAHVLSENLPTKLKIIGVNDTFGESGTPEELLIKYGLGEENLYQSALLMMNSK